MSNKFYAEIFNHSGTSYHRAMKLFPAARSEEFIAAVSLLKARSGDHVLDVPSGGAYLKQYLPEQTVYRAFDFSKGFGPELFGTSAEVQWCSETDISFQSAGAEKAICLAAMHHVEDKAAFLEELRRCLVSGGTLLIGDVVANSKEALFLNGFVNDWNSLGHNGEFICFKRDAVALQSAGFTVQTVVKNCRWNFDSESDCHQYMRHLFSLDKKPSKDQLNNAISKLGITTGDSAFQLNWSLGFMLATAE